MLSDECSVAARRRFEDEEADLVLRDVDGAVEADTRPLPRQLLGSRACSPLARGAPSGVAAGQIRLDEVARHASDATPGGTRRKRQNIGSLRASSVRERTPSLA